MEENSNINSGKNSPIKINNSNLATQNLKPLSILDQSLANLTKEQQQNLMAKAAEEALRLEIKLREHEIDYRIGKVVLEDHIEKFNKLDKKGLTTRHTVTSETKLGSGKVTIESKTGGVCFVATATYGDPEHPDVVSLRLFRDEILASYFLGTKFINWYYIKGPYIANCLNKSQKLKKISRFLLSRFVTLIKSFKFI